MRNILTLHRSTTFRPSAQLIAAFAAVYVIWGSTYLAIVFAIQTIPPLLAIALRFLAAGTILYGWMRVRGHAGPRGREVLNAAFVGALTAGAGTGTVAWAEQHLASGIVALLVTLVPIWMVLLDWKWLGGGAPSRQVSIGLVLGFVGIALLVGPDLMAAGPDADLIATLVVIAGSVSWSVGSLHGKRVSMPTNAFMSAAVQMLGGGAALLVVAGLDGEFSEFSLGAVTAASFAGWSYLVVFGSIIAFSAYVWLMANAPPKQVSSYAYVNPVVAVFLGWMLVGEQVDVRTVVAVVVLVTAVALVVRYGSGKDAARKAGPTASGARHSASGAATPSSSVNGDLGARLASNDAAASPKVVTNGAARRGLTVKRVEGLSGGPGTNAMTHSVQDREALFAESRDDDPAEALREPDLAGENRNSG